MMTNDRWMKSSRSSGNGGNCVETRATLDCSRVYVRDSKDPLGGVLSVSADQWRAFLSSLR